jgi:hypothetical protein
MYRASSGKAILIDYGDYDLVVGFCNAQLPSSGTNLEGCDPQTGRIKSKICGFEHKVALIKPANRVAS